MANRYWADAAQRMRQRFGTTRDELALRIRADLRPTPRLALRAGPVVVSGLIDDPRGVGQAARATIAALRADGFDVIAHDATPYLYGDGKGAPAPDMAGGVWIVHLNPLEMRRLMRLAPTLSAAPMLRIGFWFWELPEAPHDWLNAARHVHEIWCASRFTAAAFGRQTHAPVRALPHPLVRRPATADRARFGVEDGQVAFLAFADARSSLARKNPEGAIRAFRAAFSPDDKGVVLIVKLAGGAGHGDALTSLRAVADGAPNVRFLEQELDEASLGALMESVDVVVSLHRAESLGLVVAEGMARGKPVLVTPWSGVEDFITQGSVAPVAFTLAPVRDPQQIYREEQRWAEPDLASAADWMKRLHEDAALRARIGARALAVSADLLAPKWPREKLGADFAQFAKAGDACA